MHNCCQALGQLHGELRLALSRPRGARSGRYFGGFAVKLALELSVVRADFEGSGCARRPTGGTRHMCNCCPVLVYIECRCGAWQRPDHGHAPYHDTMALCQVGSAYARMRTPYASLRVCALSYSAAKLLILCRRPSRRCSELEVLIFLYYLTMSCMGFHTANFLRRFRHDMRTICAHAEAN